MSELLDNMRAHSIVQRLEAAPASLPPNSRAVGVDAISVDSARVSPSRARPKPNGGGSKLGGSAAEIGACRPGPSDIDVSGAVGGELSAVGKSQEPNRDGGEEEDV